MFFYFKFIGNFVEIFCFVGIFNSNIIGGSIFVCRMCIVGKYCFEKFIYEIGDCSFGFYCLINIIDGVLSLRIGLYGFI